MICCNSYIVCTMYIVHLVSNQQRKQKSKYCDTLMFNHQKSVHFH